MDANLFSGTTKYQKSLFSHKINLFGLHKIAWCQWQPTGHYSWVICKQTIDTFVPHILSWIFFFLPLIQEKQAVIYWQNKIVAK